MQLALFIHLCIRELQFGEMMVQLRMSKQTKTNFLLKLTTSQGRPLRKIWRRLRHVLLLKMVVVVANGMQYL